MSLRDKTFKNTVVVASSNVFIKILDIGTTLILVRLLEPAVFGLIAISSLLVNILALFRDFGIESALIYKKDEVSDAADTAFFVIPLISLLLYFIAFFSANFVADFYGNNVISSIIRVSSLSLILYSLGSVPLTLLSKELDFFRGVLPEIFSMVVKVFFTLLLAFNGFGVWSIVYGGVLGSLAGLISVWFISDWRPNFRFNKSIALELIGYGKYIFGLVVLVFVLTNIDDAVVGKVLGLTLLGYYSIAYSIANLPVTNITQLVNRVTFPTYSKIQDNTKKLKIAYMKTLEYISFLSVPSTFGIFVLAPDIVSFVLGSKWDVSIMVMPLRILCFYGLFRSLAITGDVFRAIGRPKFLFDVTFIQLILIVLLIIPITLRYGLIGVSILTTLGVLFSLIICTKEVMGVLGLRLFELTNLMKSQIAASFLAGVVIILLKSITQSSISSFILHVFLFSLIYLLALYSSNKMIVKDVINLTRTFFHWAIPR